MRPLVVPLRLRSLAEGGPARKVTWLELFFDLIFVAAVAQVAEPLREHYGFAELARFSPLFVLIWWAWTGHTLFSTRFDTDDVVQRVLTLLQMFAVAVMAANAKDALDSRSSAGFAAAYAAVRLVLVAQYFRARRVPGAGPLAIRYLVGHGTAAVMWLASALVPAPERFWLWMAAFVIDLGSPWLAVRHSVQVPPDAAHLPERFGLFTLILLGDSVVAVMQGMESQESWTPAAATSAFLGMAILFVIWWWYFDGASGASERPVSNRREAIRFHVWSYAHFPLYLGIAVAGVGVKQIVTTASRSTMDPAAILIVMGATAVVMVAMTVIAAASPHAHRQRPTRWLAHLALAAATIGLGVTASVTLPVALAVSLATLCVAQLALSLAGSSPAQPQGHVAGAFSVLASVVGREPRATVDGDSKDVEAW
jgi:low temperature requirement protein LtrA